MNFKRLVSSLSLIFILYSIIELAFANAEDKKKNPGRGVQGTNTNPIQPNHFLKETPEGLPIDAHQALEEIKLVTNAVEKKTAVNRNLIVGAAVTNIALLLLVSGLLGYDIKKKHDDNKKKNEKKNNETGSDREG